MGLAQPGRHHAVPRGGPEVGPDRPQGRAGPAGPHCPLPNPAPRRRQIAIVVPVRARVRPVEGPLTWQRGVPAGAAQPARRGVRHGVGPCDDRRAARVLRGGAGEDGRRVLRRGDGKGEEGIRCDARVPARCGSEGGEDLRGGVPVSEELGERCWQALAF